ncbi:MULTISPECIES: hypothetical protein [Variovorax]|nr:MULTISPECIES: hypothetical protein [Variovorax]UKI09605.1 hypothetical protein L3V85_07080 [Variovorax paradoxus]
MTTSNTPNSSPSTAAQSVAHLPMTAQLPQANGNGQAGAPIIVGNALRYHVEISKFTDCPPPSSGHQEVGYRFCFESKSDRRNFLPTSILDLSRTDGSAPAPCCSGYALSMFISLETLLEKRTKLAKRIKKFKEKKGGHYAKLALTKNCGRCASLNDDGHFDFFEYATFNAINAIIEHTEIAP